MKVSYDYEGGFFHASKRKRIAELKRVNGKNYPRNGTFTDERDAQFKISNVTKI